MIKDITTQCWILALVARDDGERLLLGDGAYEFKEKQLHFVANRYVNDTVDIQGNDGLLLAGQVRRAANQPFDGYIGDGTMNSQETEQYRQDFIKFFRKNHYYDVIYIFPDGNAIKRRKGFIVDAPEVKEIRQLSPEYHVSLNFEDVNYYQYNENSDGEEIYSDSASIPLSTTKKGGQVWDEYGLVWDSVGQVWDEGGGGGISSVQVDSIDMVYPVLTIQGPANNPTIENLSTNTSIGFNGNITSSQTLKIDMRAQTALLNGTSVINRLSGDWLMFQPGLNRVTYTAANDSAPDALIEWSEVVG